MAEFKVIYHDRHGFETQIVMYDRPSAEIVRTELTKQGYDVIRIETVRTKYKKRIK